MLVPSLYNNDIARYNFGSSLLNNTPTGDSLIHQGVTLTLTRPIFIVNDCNNNLYAYTFNETGDAIKMDFAGDITTNPTFTDLGSTGLPHIGSGAACAYNNQFTYLLIDFSTGVISKYDPFVTLTPVAALDYYTTSQSVVFPTAGTYPITLFYDMGRPSGPSVACSSIEIDKCPPPCYDTNKTKLTVTSTASDSCTFNATINTGTANTIVGYTWTVSPGGATQTDPTSSPTDSYMFTITPGTVYTVTVTIHIVDANLDCCTGVLTQTVTCTGNNGAEGRHANNAGGNGTNSIVIFPNPTSDMVTITSSSDPITTIQVIDVNGQQVGNYSYSNTTSANVSLAGLPPGTYLFRVNNATSKMIVKNK